MNLQRLNDLYDKRAEADRTDVENLRQMISDYPYFSKPYVILARHYHLSGHYKFGDMLRQAAMRVRNRKELYLYIHDQVAYPVIAPAESDTEPGTETESPASPLSFETEEAVSRPGLQEFLEESSESEEVLAEEESGLSEVPGIEESVQGSPEPGLTELNADPHTEDFVQRLDSAEIADLEEILSEEASEADKPFVFEFEDSFRSHEEPEEAILQDIIGEEIATEFSFSKSFSPPEAGPQDTGSEDVTTDTPGETPDLSLRKHPVYEPLESISGSGSGHTTEDFENKDFFSWLSNPRHTESSDEPATGPQGGDTETESRGMDIIERFIAVNPQITRPKKEFYNPENMAKRSEVPDLEFVTETLAGIYYEQGNLDLALKAYEKLSLQNPSKRAYFADLIEKIKKERK